MDELNRAIAKYYKKWERLIVSRHNKQFFQDLRPSAIGWKVQDRAELDRRFADLRDSCDRINWGWVNERWVITMHLRNQSLAQNIRVIKLMERRPGSTDAIGLDHIDFLLDDLAPVGNILKQETDLTWTLETDNPYVTWYSIWFDNTEAKIRSVSVVEVCIAELQEVAKD